MTRLVVMGSAAGRPKSCACTIPAARSTATMAATHATTAAISRAARPQLLHLGRWLLLTAASISTRLTAAYVRRFGVFAFARGRSAGRLTDEAPCDPWRPAIDRAARVGRVGRRIRYHVSSSRRRGWLALRAEARRNAAIASSAAVGSWNKASSTTMSRCPRLPAPSSST